MFEANSGCPATVVVTPADAGVQKEAINAMKPLDSRFRGNDEWDGLSKSAQDFGDTHCERLRVALALASTKTAPNLTVGLILWSFPLAESKTLS
ncbi:MAG: hypothetical protein DHS20C16_08040 [Phycisphaerae bacterium]|nr:MAG: hypothetical protein DHS20C16_08040 [Phycisphaerae bacterium]